MVDFGPRTAATFWILSLVCEILFWLSFVNVGFHWVWSFATIVDKTYKLISELNEEAFLEWAGDVWDSLCGRPPRDPRDPRDPPQGGGASELPIWRGNH